MREFCDWADSIPLMAGAVFSEMQGTLTRGDGRKNEWTQKEIDDQLTAAFGDKKNDIVAEFKQAFPRKKVQDVLYYAGGSRPGVKNLLNRKLEKSEDAGLQLRVRVGIPDQRRHHVVPLLRARVLLPRPERAADQDGDRRRPGGAWRCRTRSSQAWINFAKTGNPSQPGLEWKPYTKENPQAMVFDTVSQSVALRDDKLVSLLPAAGRGGGPPAGPAGRG